MPNRRRDHALTRNTWLAGAAFSGIMLAAIGVAFFSAPDNSVPPIDQAAARASAQLVARSTAPDPVPVVARAPADQPFEIASSGPASILVDANAAPRQTVAGKSSIVEKNVRRERAPDAPRPVQVAKAESAPTPSPVAKANRARSATKPDAEAVYLARELFADSLTTGSLGQLGGAASAEDEDGAEKAGTTLALAYAAPDHQPSTLTLSKPDIAAPAGKVSAPLALPNAKPARKLSAYEKLYGGPVRVASLAPAESLRAEESDALPRAPYDRMTAVYVITEKKVYLPDGSELEAHSGLGAKMDDPRHAHVRMHGVTPPHVYRMRMREALFHGVEAIRLLPMKGESAIFGRDGILAHTYMLGPSGQSNGCVSFRNYPAFLNAFKQGKIDRLAVIAKID